MAVRIEFETDMSQAIYAVNDVDREALSRSSGGARSATTKDSDSDAEVAAVVSTRNTGSFGGFL